MNKTNNILIISGAVLLLFGLIYFFGINRDKAYDWDLTYSPIDKDPYGTYVMKELLDTMGFKSTFIQMDGKTSEFLIDHENENDIYFFIGHTNHISNKSADTLVEFVKQGNTAFISSELLTKTFSHYFFEEINEMHLKERTTQQKIGFEHPKLLNKKNYFDYIYEHESKKKYWRYFNLSNLTPSAQKNYEILGGNDGNKVNFLKIKMGNGVFYLHSTPYLFTNINILQQKGFTYAENLLKHIPPGRIQWDQYNLQYHSDSSNKKNNKSAKNDTNTRSMLEFIFKNKSLTWAFVTLLIMVLIYAIFKGKRMQDIVKPAESKDNTSLQYIETISSLYLQEKKHGKLITLKERTFLNFIAEHYYLYATSADKTFIAKLAIKSQIEIEHIEDIFSIFENFRSHDIVSDDMLIELHRKIEYFYKHCK